MAWNNMSIVYVIVAVMALFLATSSWSLETFTNAVPVEVLTQQYKQEVRVTASYVGPYIGEIYSYLRAKYNDPLGTLPLSFQPTSGADPVLKDPLLPIARSQVRAWIDTATEKLTKTYGKAFLSEAVKHYSLTYSVEADGVLKVTYVDNAVPQTYIL